ncbi:MAG: BACON domain-containing protein [Acidobacteria bacterium]|nr:BACON domain-containing protein [Acidobacteriota bacterium]
MVTTAVTTTSVSAAGGRLEVPVLAGPDCPWAAQSEAPWISITSGGSGRGPGTVVLSAAVTEGPLRTGTVNVAGVRVTVTQLSGCRYSVQPSSYAAGAAGAAGSITLQTAAGCPWTAASAAGWITVPQTSGTGAAPVPFVVAANNSPGRMGTLTVAGNTVTVVQESTCTWRLAPPSVDYQADGGRGAILVIVVGACTWSAASTVDWITIETGHSGAGDGLVLFIVSPNPGPARSGVVRIAGIDLDVRQSGR